MQVSNRVRGSAEMGAVGIVFVVFGVALLLALLLVPQCGQSVSAQDVLSEDDAAFALALAQVCANERSLSDARPADCALIYQATRRHGDTTAERLDWLRHHSSCVLTDRRLTRFEEARGNCRWTRNLTASSDEPEGWPADWHWENHVERWAAMRAFCEGLVAGRVPRGGYPCREDPDTWGGVMDHENALSRGMRPVVCRGTRNTGYRWGRRHD